MKKSVRISIAFVGFILVLGAGVTLWNSNGSSQSTASAQVALVLPGFTALASAGNVVFDQLCAGCHGTNALGSDQGPPLLHSIYNPGHHNDESFFRAVRQGTPRHHWNFGDMPPQRDATGQDVISIIRYIRELQEANGIVWKRHKM